MAFTTRVWGAGKLLMLALALAGTFVLSAAAAFRLAVKTRDVQVPELAGRSANDASARLAELGLSMKVDETRRFEAKVGAGRVVAQEPAAGAASRRQRSVRVWLSAGPRLTKVPKLTGESERTAQLRAAQDGLTLAGVSEIRSGDFPADTVVAQDPPATSNGERVALLVNRGQRGTSYVMPDLIGLNGDRVAELLRQRGFRVAVVGDHPYPGVASGIAIRQNPQAGFQIAPGDPVSLEVSR